MSPTAPPSKSRGRLRVLFVGGESAARELEAELERGGYEPQSVLADSEAALSAALADDRFDVAICEDGSAVGGPAALRQAKRIRPDLPVIVVSSLFGESVAAAAMRAGADDFIAQGYLARLVPAVEREVRAGRMRRNWEQAALDLREAEARSDAFMNNSPTVAFMKDGSGRFVYVNRRFEETFGVSAPDVAGKSDAEVFDPVAAAEMRANDVTVLEEDRPLQFEERVVTADGERFWLVSRFPFSDGSSRRFVGAVAVDITERKKAEDALRTSEDLFRDLMEQSQALMCVHDLDGRILTANAAAGANLGYDWGIDLGGDVQRVQDILAPESLVHFPKYLAGLAATGVASGIMTVLTRSGERRHWEYRNALRTEGVERPVVRAVAIDATDRIRAERDLQETRQFSEQIIAGAGEGIIVYGPDGRFALWNPFMEKLTGLRRDEAIGRRPDEIFANTQTSGTPGFLERALAGENVIADDRAFFVPSTGRSGRMSSTFSPHRSADGRIVGVIEIVEDVTAQKRAEETLRESRASLERAQAVGQVGSWVSGVGPDDTLTWSRETCRIFGVEPDEFDGRLETFFARIHPEDLDAVRAAVAGAILGGRPYRIEHRICRPDGTIRWVSERADLFCDPQGRPIRLEGVVQDITERRRLEEQFLQAQKMEAIGRLAGGVAHDFNNLLTAILGYTDLLLTGMPSSDHRRDDLEEIQRAGERAAGLTRQLLAFSRQQMLEPKVVDVNAIVRNLQRMLARVIGEDVRLVTTLGEDLDPVRADPGQLEQVLVNLAVNSRDAMPAGGVITIETSGLNLEQPLDLGRYAIAPGRYVRIEVRDTGTGMDAATLERIFEPFFTTKERGKGTGLGLATAYGIVKQSGGYIACDSETGRGTRFQIYLPRSLELPEAAAGGRAGPDRESLRGTETVLLVEDEEGVRRLCRKLLEAHGYRVLEAAGGDEALELAARYPAKIHLVLTDIVMPGVSGPELAVRVEALRPGIKVLYMTGYSDAAVAGLVADLPLLQKPFTPDALAERVRETLAG